MSKNKIIMLIVEGITDKISLELAIQSIIPNDKKVIFTIVHGDITTNNSITSSNIMNRIEEVMNNNGRNKFQVADYDQVVHLVDLDGAFIPSDHVIEDHESNSIEYSEEGISTNNRERTLKRNQHKQNMLGLLVGKKLIKGAIPYRVFFFSTNLEHVLHNIINVPDTEKRNYASDFEDWSAENPIAFIDFICNSSFSLNMEYLESWDFVKEGLNSLSRCTNFDIFIKELSEC